MRLLKLWHVTAPNFEGGYDTYSDFVVAAYTSKEAQETHPSYDKAVKWDIPVGVAPNGEFCDPDDYDPEDNYFCYCGSWVRRPDETVAKCIGMADVGVEPGLIIASYHAG